MTTEKRWTDRLGKYDDAKHYRDGELISEQREDGYHVIWSFDSEDDADAAFEAWKHEPTEVDHAS
jgi:hypothetical protein